MDIHDHNQEQINLYVALGKIQASQELILEGLRGHFKDDKEAFQKIDERMSNLETKINYAAGTVAVAVFVIGLFWNFIAKKVGLV